MKCSVVPYEGEQAYIFFSYCHEDAAVVYPIIERLADEGFRIWYDDGIHPGDDWPEVVAQHLNSARICIAAISVASTVSHNCKNEVNFAIGRNKPTLSVLLEDFQMPLGIQLQLSSTNYIRKYEYDEEGFYQKLLASALLSDTSVRADKAEISRWEAERREKAEQERLAREAELRRQEAEKAAQREKAEQERLAREAELRRQMPRPVICCNGGQYLNDRIALSSGSVMFGRRPECTVQFENKTEGVSGKHCTVAWNSEQRCFEVRDLGSTYGTYIKSSGMRLTAHQVYRLQPGETLFLGSSSNSLHLELD